MKQGTTTTFNFHFNIDLNQVDSIDFFFHCDRDNKQKRQPLLTKSYPTDGYEQDGVIYMPLKQEETAVLPNKFYIEPQINFIDKSSTKAHTKAYNMEPTIYTHFIDENQSNGEEENIDIEFEVDESIVIKGYDYDESYHKPRINDNELAGNKTGAELGLQDKLIAGVNITIAADGKTISAANGGKFIIVEELPEEDIDLTAIYLLPREDEEESNIYDEYIYIENISEWEKIGSTEVNLENYYTKDETDELLDDKQDILSVIGHMSINNNVITTEANKVYQAVMNGDNISTDIADYPNIEMGDIAINYSNKIRIWVQTTNPHDFVFWDEIKYSNQKITESENAPASSGYSSQYKVGDLWLQKIVSDTTTYKVFILVNIAEMIPPQTLTWVDLTSGTEYTGGNGVKIENDEISVDLSSDQTQLLKFLNEQLILQPFDIADNDTIRTELVNSHIPNPLASKSYVDDLMSGATKWEFVSQLPTENIDKHTIYFVPKATAETDNIYDEWVYAIQSRNPDVYDWELLGTSQVDLSNYYTKTESDDKFQNKLTVGNGIDITSDTISVKVKSNSGLGVDDNGLSVYVYDLNATTDNLITVDNNKLKLASYTIATNNDVRYGLLQTYQENNIQPRLTAGTNITIDSNNVISASGGGLSYNFTNGLAESSGTVGIDLASGSKLLIDAYDKLDVDLSSKQDTIDSTHKLDADLVDDSTSTNQFVTATEKSTWNGKEDKTDITTDTTSTTVSLTLADNHEYRYTQDLTSLTLTMPSGDFIASIVFASGSTPTSMTYDSSIKWSGDDVTNGQFVPTEKTYNIVMWYDGINVNGVVRGV